ncbi:MAG: MerR family DNA-binding transcriptional regulator [Alphaproteobacteria bacterium]|nr:MerR family DNA-binding transcriptional regulator [Alphaproteobacteria bacterium]
MPDLLRIRDAAALLGVSPKTLRRWDLSGKLRAVRHPVSGYRLYPREQLTAFRLEEVRVPAAAPAFAIPRPSTAFVGRAQELAQLDALLAAPGALVTLLGPPGVGKTRLALEACARGSLRAGFVDLSACERLEDLIRAVALALELPLSGSAAEALPRLGEPLASGDLDLLVLDNVEQVAEATRQALAAWRPRAPGLRLLLTSRRPLEVDGEGRLLLAPLAVEASEGRPEALELLLARLREQRPRYRPKRKELEALTALTRDLEGLPLALELAAPALARGEAPSPRASLEASVARSWALLSLEEQRALVALSALVAPCAPAVACAVIGEAQAPDRLEALLQSSMVQRQPDGRLRLLAFVRAFVARQDPAHRSAACARRAQGLAEEVEGLLHPYQGVTRPEPRERLRRLHPELQAALADALRLGLPEAAATLARGMLAADHLAGDTLERTAPLLRDPDISARGRGLLLLQRSLILRRILRSELLLQELELGLSLADEADDPDLKAHLGLRLAAALGIAGRSAEAHAALEEAEAHLRTRGDGRGQAGALHTRAMLVLLKDAGGQEASALFERAAEGMRDAGDLLAYTATLSNLARLRAARGFGQALELALSALSAARRARAHTIEAFTQVTLGMALQDQGELTAARARFVTGAEHHARLGSTVRASDARLRVALVDLEAGDLLRARAQAEYALTLAEGGPERWRRLAELVSLAAQAPTEDPRVIQARCAALEGPLGQDWSLRALERLLLLLIRLQLRDRLPDALPAGEDVQATLEALDPACAGNQPLRCLARLVRRAAAGEAAERALQLSADAARFRLGAAPEQDLSRHPAEVRLLDGLARAHAATPGRPMSAAELVHLGWSGERMRPSSAAQRVRTAIWSLRRAGLEGVLETVEGGYRLDPALRVAWEAPPQGGPSRGTGSAWTEVYPALDPELQRRLAQRCAQEGIRVEEALDRALRAWLA